MIKKLKYQTARGLYPNFPKADYLSDSYEFPKTFKTETFTIPSKSLRGHATQLGIQFRQLMTAMQIKSLIFLPDQKTTWRSSRENTYQPLQPAIQYFDDLKLGPRFNGGLIVDWQDFSLHIKYHFYMVRTNSFLPYIWFMDANQIILGNICQYGSLHISIFDKSGDHLLKRSIKQTSFEKVQGSCSNSFSKTSAIPGRQSTI